MAAYLIGRITVKDPQKWESYRRQVPATLAPWQAEVVFRGKPFAAFSGAIDHSDVVVLRFADSAAAREWFDSPAYRALIPLREEAADVTLVAYES